MKKQFVKLTAFAAAGLLIIGAAAPCLPVKAYAYFDDNYDMDDDDSYYNYGPDILYSAVDDPDDIIYGYEVEKSPYPDWISSCPDWTEDMAKKPNKPLDYSALQEGKFYIWTSFESQGLSVYRAYKLIRIDKLAVEKDKWNRKLETVYFTEIKSGSKNLILESNSFIWGCWYDFELYEIPD